MVNGKNIWSFLCRAFLLGLVFPLFSADFFAQDPKSKISGQVKDPFGHLVVGAKVVLTGENGEQLAIITDGVGKYSFTQIKAGNYTLEVEKTGFSIYKHKDIFLSGDPVIIDVVLQIRLEEQKVSVTDTDTRPDPAPDRNTDTTVLRENELAALPDDPDALEAALRALAGPSAGPDGGEIYIDGFLSRNIPPKSSIREVRINRNPFSAEFDRIGYGRIEIITKIGSTSFQGSAFFAFSDESLNARDSFADYRYPFQLRRYGGNLSDSFLKKRASYFVDIARRELDDSAVVSATILDEQLRIVSLRRNLVNPQRSVHFNARTDFQLGTNNTLSIRYGNWINSNVNSNVGGLIIPSQGYKTTNSRRTFQLIQTSVLKENLVNEFRFQFEHSQRRNLGDTLLPAVIVSESFFGGSSQTGNSFVSENRLEVNDNITVVHKNHTVRLGGRFRATRVNDTSPNNFGGTLIFTGGLGPKLDENGEIVIGDDGTPIMELISSIERYRRTEFFRQQGLPQTSVRERGGGVAQLSISGGNPSAKVTQVDFSAYLQNDWRVRPNLSFSLGLRMETQTNIGKNPDLAPRVSFAWSKETGRKKKLTTVIRGGAGLFYSRISENLILQARRYDGNTLMEYRISDSGLLDSFDGIPGVEELAFLGQQVALRRIGAVIRPARGLHSAVNVEQQLPFGSNLTITFSDFRVWNVLRSRNVNAPFEVNLPRPNEDFGDIYQFESSGQFESRRLRVVFSKRFGRNNLDVRYDLLSAKSDTDGVGSFPINQRDFSGEFGRASTDIRHSLFANVFFTLPQKIRLSSMVIATSGRPFNITLGQDLNGDSLFTERPAFATNVNSPTAVLTKWGAFDTNIDANSTIIPRNYGTGSPYFTTSISISRTFSIDSVLGQRRKSDKKTPSRFSLNLSSQIWNVFNSNNLQNPIGNLTSPLFGKAISMAGSYGRGDPLSGGRVVEFRARLSF